MSANWCLEVLHAEVHMRVLNLQVECVTREVGDGVIEAAKLRQDGCTGVIVLVTFATVSPCSGNLSAQPISWSVISCWWRVSCSMVDGLQVKGAVEAVPKLHKAGLQIGEAGGKGGKRGGQHLLWARQLKGEGSMVKKWRVIMRNLPFNVSSSVRNAWLQPNSGD